MPAGGFLTARWYSEFRGSVATAKHQILLAEDNPINQRVATLILKRSGYDCDVVEDGLAAVQACIAHPYDLILMDCQMPVMSGFQATREIRRLPIPQPKIIAVTANCTTEAEKECVEAGMDNFFPKPFTAESLIHLITSALQLPSGSRPMLDCGPMASRAA